MSHGSRPAPNLTVYINDESVDPDWDSRELVFVNETSGLETAVKSLQFPLRVTMVQLDGLQVKCVASIPEIYWLSSETTLSVELHHNYSHPIVSQGSFIWIFSGGPQISFTTTSEKPVPSVVISPSEATQESDMIPDADKEGISQKTKETIPENVLSNNKVELLSKAV
ncbi:uncharacterized protein [Panulirus ornatus]|uniref:uncharacterized protein n=1 Tax=Panulirus ornatus TaxID=150431 RepID=UPI003A84AF92